MPTADELSDLGVRQQAAGDRSAAAASYERAIAAHPGHAVARAELRRPLFGGMLSFQVEAGEAAAVAAVARAAVFRRATSLGSTESLLEHRRSVEIASAGTSDTPADLIRVSVGLEDAEDLIADMAQALEP